MKTMKKTLFISCTLLALSGCDVDSTGADTTAAPSNESVSESSQVICSNCGTVAGITPVTVKGDGSGAGVVLGAVVGGLLGHQVGGGSGKDVATVVGAVGGAFAGNEIEKQTKKQTYYDVTVEMDDGTVRTVSVASVEHLRAGTPVRVVGNNLELL